MHPYGMFYPRSVVYPSAALCWVSVVDVASLFVSRQLDMSPEVFDSLRINSGCRPGCLIKPSRVCLGLSGIFRVNYSTSFATVLMEGVVFSMSPLQVAGHSKDTNSARTSDPSRAASTLHYSQAIGHLGACAAATSGALQG